ncbi:DUF2608 domain-containing protein [Chlamydiifrater phoenicopteri]|uniref:DUF2608 domain-containing protein n=1 Tax=Chlamydiifrater phoenicopteri TaxID=2681469 RepID=UPI001BCCDD5F|nr:DUF2608 domain-containing protein [Chlamydiifrater phoenicopteri]
MNALLSLAFLSALLIATPSYAKKNRQPTRKIIYSFSEVKNFLTPGCLVCIGVDDTLSQHRHLGGLGWQKQRLEYLQERKMSCQAAKRRMLRESAAISTFLPKELLEAEIPFRFQELVDNFEIFLMGMSAKGLESVPSVMSSLLQQGIDFDTRPLFPEDFFLSPKRGLSASGVFTDGVLFCGGFTETEAFTELWIRKSPSLRRLVFVHGDPAVVQSMEKTAKELSLAYTGLVYYPATETVFSFAPPYSTAVAMQSETALKILPDDLAYKALAMLEE